MIVSHASHAVLDGERKCSEHKAGREELGFKESVAFILQVGREETLSQLVKIINHTVNFFRGGAVFFLIRRGIRKKEDSRQRSERRNFTFSAGSESFQRAADDAQNL